VPALHDPTVLRAIAHPLRNRILAELRASGPMRAADVARLLDVPANQASFHLRQLAKYGLIEDDADAARDRRDRVWRLTDLAELDIDVGELERAPGGAAAVAVFRRNSAAWHHHVVDRAYAPRDDAGDHGHRSVSESALRLTAEEARELTAEVGEVLTRWHDRTQGRAADGRRTYLHLGIVQPYPEAGPDPDDEDA
jgi:DNA-binding transcriptional ArsR family regulator